VKRALFVVAAALLAAATANPIVESIADSGIVGSGYADHDQSSVGPTLAIAALFALAFVVLRVTRLLKGTADRESVLSSVARDLARRAPASDLPIVFALQFVALYAMERVECLTGGGVESGLAWLGGPAFFAIAVHVLVGIAITIGLGRGLRSFAGLLATAVRAVLEAIAFVRIRTVAAAFAKQTYDAVAGRSLASVRAIRGRAPPHSPIRT
jgi:hypothetical protein